MKMNEKNKILLRRRWKLDVVQVPNIDPLPLAFVATASENLRALGFIFKPDLVDALRYLTKEDFQIVYKDLEVFLSKMVGRPSSSPMYPNFPKQVMEAHAVELWLNAMIHYFGDWAGYRWMPDYVKKDRKELSESERNLQVIGLADVTDFSDIAKLILSSKSSLSEQDTEDLRFVIKAYADDIHTILPETFPHKENFVLIANEVKSDPKP